MGLTQTLILKTGRGLNTQASEITIGQDQCLDCQNMVLSPIQGFSKILGATNYTSTGLPATGICTGLWDYYKRDDTHKMITQWSTGKAYYDTGTAWSLIYSGGTAGNKLCDSALHNNMFIFTNYAQNNIRKWTGSGFSADLGGSPPKAKFLAEFENHLFLAGDGTNPHLLYYSELNDPETYGATSYLNFNLPITGIKRFRSNLIVFCSSSVYAVTFTGDSRLPFIKDILVEGVGCISHWSIKVIEGTLYFAAKDGIYTINSESTIAKISEEIQPNWDTFNASRLNTVYATVDKVYGLYRLLISTGSNIENNKSYAYDYKQKAWLIDSYPIKGNVWNNIPVSNADTIYMGTYSGKILKMYTGANFVGSAIPAYYTTARLNAGTDKLKRWKRIVILHNSTGYYDMTVYYGDDFNIPSVNQTFKLGDSATSTFSSAIFDSSLFNAEGGMKRSYIWPHTTSQWIQLKFENNIKDQEAEIAIVFIEYETWEKRTE